MQMRVLRRIEGISRLDRVRNVDLRGRLKQEGVLDTVKKRQQNWKQRVEEMSYQQSDEENLRWRDSRKAPSRKTQEEMEL